MSGPSGFLRWARQRSRPRDLIPTAIGAWLLKTGITTGNETFVFIALYLFGLVPAWWADGKGPPMEAPSAPEAPEAPESE